MHELDIRVVRIFNTYGPNMEINDGRVVSNFIVQALRGEDITVYGDGSQTRSFCFVSDLVRGLMDFMNQDGFHGPMNLGNDREFTILELAEKSDSTNGRKIEDYIQRVTGGRSGTQKTGSEPSPGEKFHLIPGCSSTMV